jgi:hypothetical protein
MSVSARLIAAVDAYINERGFGSRTGVAEAALAEFLEKKGYRIEPTPEEFNKALKQSPKPRKRSK